MRCHSSDRTGRSTGAAHNGCKKNSNVLNSAYSAVNKIVQMKELKEEDGYLMSQTLQKQERD
jgi:hypothetical protein